MLLTKYVCCLNFLFMNQKHFFFFFFTNFRWVGGIYRCTNWSPSVKIPMVLWNGMILFFHFMLLFDVSGFSIMLFRGSRVPRTEPVFFISLAYFWHLLWYHYPWRWRQRKSHSPQQTYTYRILTPCCKQSALSLLVDALQLLLSSPMVLKVYDSFSWNLQSSLLFYSYIEDQMISSKIGFIPFTKKRIFLRIVI